MLTTSSSTFHGLCWKARPYAVTVAMVAIVPNTVPAIRSSMPKTRWAALRARVGSVGAASIAGESVAARLTRNIVRSG